MGDGCGLEGGEGVWGVEGGGGWGDNGINIGGGC